MRHELANDELWLVVHTPKTAGTSFRWALEKHFGKPNVIRDYGPHSPVTSDVVSRHLYNGEEPQNPGGLVTELSNGGSRVLIGHFPLLRYASFFKQERIITFVRDPLIRMCSEYLHRTKDGSFTGTFAEFLQRPGYQNMQSKLLSGISAGTFIGITEHYPKCLQFINRATGWKLSMRKKNVGRRGGGDKFAKNLSAHELNMFYKMNAEDVELYRYATRRFAELESSGSQK